MQEEIFQQLVASEQGKFKKNLKTYSKKQKSSCTSGDIPNAHVARYK